MTRAALLMAGITMTAGIFGCSAAATIEQSYVLEVRDRESGDVAPGVRVAFVAFQGDEADENIAGSSQSAITDQNGQVEFVHKMVFTCDPMELESCPSPGDVFDDFLVDETIRIEVSEFLQSENLEITLTEGNQVDGAEYSVSVVSISEATVSQPSETAS